MSTRRPVVAGNWKMHLDHVQAVHVVSQLSIQLRTMDVDPVDVVLLPPFTDLRSVSSVFDADGVEAALGAQHLSEHDEGAYTGEVSGSMLARLGVTIALVGHSERRRLFHMDDETVGRTAAAARRAGLVPMVCVGETEEERADGATDEVLARQLTAALDGLGEVDGSQLLVAYEPVWAIGAGQTATPEDAQTACKSLRELAGPRLTGGAGSLRILYGGSVEASNVADLVSVPDVDGVLVGGASVEATGFAAIVGAVADCYRSSGTSPRR